MDRVSLAECYQQKAKSSKKRGKTFKLSFTCFANLKAQTHCAYSGVPFDSDVHQFSFERINNFIGYEDGNVIAVSRALNTARGNLSSSDAVLNAIDEAIQMNEKRKNCINQKRAKIGQTERDLKLCNTATETIQIEKLVIPARFHDKWRSTHNHLTSVNTSLKRRNELLAEVKTNIENLRKSNSPKAHIKIQNLMVIERNHTTKIKVLNNEIKRARKFIDILERRKITVTRATNNQELIDAHKAAVAEYEHLMHCIETNETKINHLKSVALGLTRFENISYLEEERLKLGLPIDAPLSDLLKARLYII